MKVKIFNGFGEYSSDMDFDEFTKSGFEFASGFEMNIFYNMKTIIKNSKGKSRKDIEEILTKYYNKTSWKNYMYKDRFEYLMNKAF